MTVSDKAKEKLQELERLICLIDTVAEELKFQNNRAYVGQRNNASTLIRLAYKEPNLIPSALMYFSSLMGYLLGYMDGKGEDFRRRTRPELLSSIDDYVERMEKDVDEIVERGIYE